MMTSTTPIMGRNRYVFTLIDNFSQYMQTYLMKEKSEAFLNLKKIQRIGGKRNRKDFESVSK